jgi:hypothetical protein
MCANFTDSGVYCESCVSAVETEDFVASQSKKLNKSEIDLVISKHAEDLEAEQAQNKRGKDTVIIWSGVGGGIAMIFVSLLLYAYPMLFLDSEVAAAFEASQALEECRLVFEEIGYLLEEGEEPDPSLRCPGATVPNIVEREGSIVRVLHPNPGMYGLNAIYVSNESHEVVLEG